MFVHRGMVGVILAKESFSSGQVLSASDVDLNIKGNSDYEVKFWFLCSDSPNYYWSYLVGTSPF